METANKSIKPEKDRCKVNYPGFLVGNRMLWKDNELL